MRKKHYGSRWGLAIFYFFIRIAGVRSAYLLLHLIIPYYLILRPSVIRNCRPYLSRRFPEDGGFRRFFRTAKYINHFGRNLIDQAAMGILGPGKFRVDFPQNDAMVNRSRNVESGYVLQVSHIGSWEVAMAYVGRMEKTVHFIMDKANAERKDSHFFEMAGEEFAFRFIDPYGYMGGMLEATSVLEENQIVSLMGDRAENTRSVKVPFFGEPASFPQIGPYLASVMDKDLYILLTARTGRLSFSARLINLTEKLPPGELKRNDKIAVYLQLYAEEIERHLQEHPYSWFNFFDFWGVE